jgi:hypothetical protein
VLKINIILYVYDLSLDADSNNLYQLIRKKKSSALFV